MFSSEDSFFKSIADYLIILLFCCKNLFQIERYLLLRTPSHFVYILSMSETAHEVGMFVSTDIVSEYTCWARQLDRAAREGPGCGNNDNLVPIQTTSRS